MRKKIIAGNWKMNKLLKEAEELVLCLKDKVSDIDSVEIVVCPVYVHLYPISQILKDSNIKLGAQDCFWEEKGAYTGEVAPSMLKDIGVEYVIIGHSERRQFFFETNQWVNRKVKAALNAGLKPIICVGEKLEEREKGQTFSVIETQLREGLADLSAEQMSNCVIAYEPVWAIGTGKTATPEQAQEVHRFIRDWLSGRFDRQVASSIRIQYGGSVKPANAKQLLSQPDIDGALVGGASLKCEDFSAIVEAGL